MSSFLTLRAGLRTRLVFDGGENATVFSISVLIVVSLRDCFFTEVFGARFLFLLRLEVEGMTSSISGVGDLSSSLIEAFKAKRDRDLVERLGGEVDVALIIFAVSFDILEVRMVGI